MMDNRPPLSYDRDAPRLEHHNRDRSRFSFYSLDLMTVISVKSITPVKKDRKARIPADTDTNARFVTTRPHLP